MEFFMCGIAGFFQTKYNISNEQTYYFLKNKLEKMKNAIKHRGPDDDDIYLSGFLNNNGFSDKTEFPNNIIGGFVGFAHSRLSIRDIKYTILIIYVKCYHLLILVLKQPVTQK